MTSRSGDVSRKWRIPAAMSGLARRRYPAAVKAPRRSAMVFRLVDRIKTWRFSGEAPPARASGIEDDVCRRRRSRSSRKRPFEIRKNIHIEKSRHSQDYSQSAHFLGFQTVAIKRDALSGVFHFIHWRIAEAVRSSLMLLEAKLKGHVFHKIGTASLGQIQISSVFPLLGTS